MRWITHSQNSALGAIRNNGGTSRYIGVSYSKKHKLWSMQIIRDGKYHQSWYKTEESAAAAYQKIAEKYQTRFDGKLYVPHEA
jgi:hypothetical protein